MCSKSRNLRGGGALAFFGRWVADVPRRGRRDSPRPGMGVPLRTEKKSPELAEAFVASRLDGRRGESFGTLDAGLVTAAGATAIERATVTA